MKWTEVLEIAIQLSEAHPDVDPKPCGLRICITGWWYCLSLTMTPAVVGRRCWRRFSRHGLMRWIDLLVWGNDARGASCFFADV